MIRIIEKNDLVAHTAEVGAYVYDALAALQEEASVNGLLINLRGKGCVSLPSLSRRKTVGAMEADDRPSVFTPQRGHLHRL